MSRVLLLQQGPAPGSKWVSQPIPFESRVHFNFYRRSAIVILNLPLPDAFSAAARTRITDASVAEVIVFVATRFASPHAPAWNATGSIF